MNRLDEIVSRETLEQEMERIHFRSEMGDPVIRKLQRKVPFLELEIRIPVPVVAAVCLLLIGTALFPTLSHHSSDDQEQQVVVTDSGVFDQKLLARRVP